MFRSGALAWVHEAPANRVVQISRTGAPFPFDVVLPEAFWRSMHEQALLCRRAGLPYWISQEIKPCLPA